MFLRRVFWSDFLFGDYVWCLGYGGCWYTLQVSSYFLLGLGSSFLWRCQLSLPRPPMVDWRFSLELEARRLHLVFSLTRWISGLGSDQTRCVSFPGLHQCSALTLFNNLQFRAVNLRVLASNVHHVFCVLQSASLSFPIPRPRPQTLISLTPLTCP